MHVVVSLFGWLLVLALLLGIVRLALALYGTITWSLSGETGSLLRRIYGTRGKRARRTVELQTLLGQVGVAVRLNLPLPTALRAAAAGELPRVSRMLKDMATLLEAGCPLSEALRLGVPGCPLLLPALVRRGEECGQLRQAFTDAEAMLEQRLRRQISRAGPVGLYALVVLLIGIGIVGGVMVIVVPKFKVIFEDFDATLPPATVRLIEVSDWIVHGGGLGLVWLVLAVGVVAGVVLLVVQLSPRDRPGPVARAVAALRWAFPITRHIDFGLGMAGAIRALGWAMRSGLPLAVAVPPAQTVAQTNRLRSRLARFVALTQEGWAPADAAERERLGAVFTAALRIVQRGGDSGTVVRHAAEYYEANAQRWWHACTALSVPLMTLLLAGVVGSVALALFMPLVTLIQWTAESIG
ncbi:MAG TPA: type II secretion system F family protein [Phycisphaerae bacterium]|nr:type II secretion system F family protein [Phycisphaerae bacterium]HNU43923.1 type II secretion system F family protein [Phycisphaerae bacterium]